MWRYNGMIEKGWNNKVVALTVKGKSSIQEWTLTTKARIRIFPNKLRNIVHAPLEYLWDWINNKQQKSNDQ